MTDDELRELAAVAALQGILACPSEAGSSEEAASQAWDCAEAFMAERKRRDDAPHKPSVQGDGGIVT